MRARRIQTITIRSGRLLICDPGYLFEPIESEPWINIPPGAHYFDDFGGDGSFKVYTNGRTVVVDTAPRQFKAKSRADFRQLDGSVPVDYGMIAFLDADEAVPEDPDVNVEHLLFYLDLPCGEYKVWQERNENSEAFRDRILCVGPNVELLLHGPDANQLMSIEKEVALALRLKGKEKGQRIQELRDTLLNLHLAGVRDRRLSDLASVLKLKLPRLRKPTVS